VRRLGLLCPGHPRDHWRSGGYQRDAPPRPGPRARGHVHRHAGSRELAGGLARPVARRRHLPVPLRCALGRPPRVDRGSALQHRRRTDAGGQPSPRHQRGGGGRTSGDCRPHGHAGSGATTNLKLFLIGVVENTWPASSWTLMASGPARQGHQRSGCYERRAFEHHVPRHDDPASSLWPTPRQSTRGPVASTSARRASLPLHTAGVGALDGFDPVQVTNLPSATLTTPISTQKKRKVGT